jgi:hypothetical protein
MRRIILIVIISCSCVACSYATPDTSSIGLSYTGGDWEAKKFNKCVPAGAVEPEDVGGYTAAIEPVRGLCRRVRPRGGGPLRCLRRPRLGGPAPGG